MSKLIRQNEHKEAEIFALKCQVDGEQSIQESEKDEQIVQLTDKLGRNEKERFLDKEALCKAQEELSDLNDKYIELEVSSLLFGYETVGYSNTLKVKKLVKRCLFFIHF